MTSFQRLSLAVAACLTLAACNSDSTGTGTTTPPNVSGTWNATEFQFVSQANSSTAEDFAVTSGPVVMVITSTTFAITTQGTTAFSGTYTETSNSFVANGTDSKGNASTITFTMVLNGSTLSLTSGSTTHKFTGTSTEVAAYLNMVLTKQ